MASIDSNVFYITPQNTVAINPEHKQCHCEHCHCKTPKQIDDIPSLYLGRDLIKQVDIIKAGDGNIDRAYSAETKPGSATFTLASGNEVFPNVWDSDGGYYTPNEGDIILGYGEVPRSWGICNPDVLAEMDKNGLDTYPDRAVSSEPDIMYETYLGADGRDFKEFPLQPGETIDAEKKVFPTKFLFVKPGSLVETLETKEGSSSLEKVGEFQYVQFDINGNPYVKDIKDLIKRLKPTDDKSTEVFEQVKEIIKKRDEILADESTNDNMKETMLHHLWLNFLNNDFT